MNLAKLNVQELNKKEMMTTDGGSILGAIFIVAFVVAFVVAALDGDYRSEAVVNGQRVGV